MAKIAVLGTGVVGTTIASKLVALGHEVKLGSRTADNEKGLAWADGAGKLGSTGTFADAAAFGEQVWNATLGLASIEALTLAGAANLAGKVIVDISNALDFSQGFPPRVVLDGPSLGEQIQAAFPQARVVKTLNTMNAYIMVDPSRVPGAHDVFVSGNDPTAKAEVAAILREGFGWENVIDLGDITAARGTEAYVALWVRLFGALGTGDFNINVVKAG